MLDIRRLSSQDADFSVQFNNLLQQNQSAENDVRHTVEAILKDVRENGDQALLSYTEKFDQVSAKQISELEITKQKMQQALAQISTEQRDALEAAAKRIQEHAEKQSLQSWSSKDDDGNELGQRITALESVGVYVPGGKAAYPSSVLMNVIPAKVAGVDSIVMVVPTPRGEVNDMVLAAACIAGVDRVFTIGTRKCLCCIG
jgi:histidinol dehydrogenase